jgi:GNAT superfamily N-acetyltransferase
MCKDFWSSTQGEAYDHEHTEIKLKSIYDNHIILISESKGSVTGFIIVAITENLCSSILTACELAWYVKPCSRGGRDGVSLLKAAESYAKISGCAKMSMVFMESSMPESIKLIYDKLGYNLKETRYERAL